MDPLYLLCPASSSLVNNDTDAKLSTFPSAFTASPMSDLLACLTQGSERLRDLHMSPKPVHGRART